MNPAETSPPPLLLIHGLWDTPRVFDKLMALLLDRQPKLELFAPHLPHGLGHVPIRELAAELAERITVRFGQHTPLDVLGFSMGGVIARTWLQEWRGHERTRCFVSLGSPQQGTLMAQSVPHRLLPGIADMKVGSPLLRDLRRDSHLLAQLRCHSLYTATDATVVPGWRAVLPCGSRQALPVFTHRQLIRDPRALEPLAALLLKGVPVERGLARG